MDPSRSVEEHAVRALWQVRELARWAGDGRALTQTGRIRLADARELVALLGTRDPIERRVTSSAEHGELTLVVEWAKACGLVRVVHGRLVAVKKHARLRDDVLWARMFDAFPGLGHAVCFGGWAQSLLREEFRLTIEGVLFVAYRRAARLPLSAAYALAWELASLPYVLDAASELQLSTARALNDRDLRRALTLLEELGAVSLAGGAVALTERGRERMRRAIGDPAAGIASQFDAAAIDVSAADAAA